MPAGVGAVGPETPHLREIEQLGKHAEDPVGLVGAVPILVVNGGHVGPANVDDLAGAEGGLDDVVNDRAIVPLGRGLQADLDVIAQEPIADVFEGRGTTMCADLLRGVLTLRDIAQEFLGTKAGLLNGQGTIAAALHATGSAGGAVLDHEGLGALRRHPDAEATQLFIPNEVVARLRRKRVDRAFREA